VKQQFEPCRMRRASLDIIEQANTTITEYQADGYALTVRQLYYQFVGRGLFTENSQKMYDKLGRIISDGRKCGLIDWDVIVDRTRSLKAWPAYGSPSDLIDPSQFDVDRPSLYARSLGRKRGAAGCSSTWLLTLGCSILRMPWLCI